MDWNARNNHAPSGAATHTDVVTETTSTSLPYADPRASIRPTASAVAGPTDRTVMSWSIAS